MFSLSLLGLISLAVAQNVTFPPLIPPSVTLLYRADVELGDRFSLGAIPVGQERVVIPIIGGTFKGPKFSGKILNLGADWRLTDVNGIVRPDARYNLLTDDGTYVYIQTEGPTLTDGHSVLRAKFETATNGTYAWLNQVVGVGILTRSGTSRVFIDMWDFRSGGNGTVG
ncbi:hypothetical protein BT63DRAFT_87420 [Microthyrium microscopicum]|uniref:Uncharacterized protein n=1 Tax=Microthyrium microscopicum TaxID=703497 RepID=A0A6A6TZD6_9PEZI|nr:hypothetical protein BT63DRAFT_87420 [Microthyrium microscopicum]